MLWGRRFSSMNHVNTNERDGEWDRTAAKTRWEWDWFMFEYMLYVFVLFSEDKKWGHTAWRAHPRPRWGQIAWDRHPIARTRTDACGIQHPRWWAGATTATTWRQCSAGALAVAIQVFDFISFISLTAFLCSGVSSQVEPGPPPPSQLQSRFSIRSVLSSFNSILLQWCLFTHAI